MADTTYKQAQAANELVTGTPGANQEQITGAEVVGATSAANVDSGWTFATLKDWVKLDADWMSKSVYDSGGDGRVDVAETLSDGVNTSTAAQVRSHIDNTSIHFTIQDGATTTSSVWSSSKIQSELNALSQFPEAPPTGSLYSRRGDTTSWEISPLTPIGGLFLRYNWVAALSGNPGSGNIGCNNPDFKLATEIRVSATTRSGNSAAPIWSTWKPGDYVTLQHDTNGTFNSYTVSAPIVDNAGWFTVPVTPIAGGSGTLSAGEPVTSTQVLNPSSRVPAGGQAGEALVKNTNSDWDTGWAAVGDVTGPGTVVDGRLTLFDGVTGQLIKQGTLTEPDIIALTVDNQFAGLTEKLTPAGTDLLVIEDSAAAGAKKRVPWSSLPTGGGGGSRHIIQDEGVGIPDSENRTSLNFTGATIQAADNLAQDRVDITVTAIDASGVTYENLDTNGDVGTGAGQVEPGLDVPAQDGFVLSSTVAGVRSWVAKDAAVDFSVQTIVGTVAAGGLVDAGNGVAVVGWDATNSRPFFNIAVNDAGGFMPAVGFGLTNASAGQQVTIAVYGSHAFDTVSRGWAAGDKLFQASGVIDTTIPTNSGELQYIGKVLADGFVFIEPDSYGFAGTGGGIPEAPQNGFGHVRRNAAWEQGSVVRQGATNPGGQAIGDFTFVTGP